jgi:hypothetical protein
MYIARLGGSEMGDRRVTRWRGMLDPTAAVLPNGTTVAEVRR